MNNEKFKVLILVFLLITLFSTNVMASEELEIWHYFADSEGMEYVIEEYNQNNSIKVNSRYIHVSELGNQLTRAILMNDTPDMVILSSDMIARFASNGSLANLNKFASNWEYKSKFYDEAWESGKYNDNLYAIPQNINTLAIFYNKDLFKRNGLETPPQNWKELVEYSRIITDKKDKVYGFSFSAPKNEQLSFQMAPFLWQSGADFYNLNNKKAYSAINLWKKMIDQSYTPKSVLNPPQYELAVNFSSGNIGMMVNGPWSIGVLEDANFEYGVFKMPVNKKVNKPYSVLGGESIAILNNSDMKKESWKFIKFFLNKDVIKTWGELEDRIPARKDAIVSKSEAMKVFKEQLNFAKSRPAHPEYSKISAALQTAVQNSLTGGDVKKSLNNAQEKINKIVD